MEYVAVGSSNVAAVGYDEDQAVLGVRYIKTGEYHYLGVPREVYDGVFSAPSVGQYLNTYVKNAGYPYQRIG